MNLAVLNMLKAIAEKQYIEENNKPFELLRASKLDQRSIYIAKLMSDDTGSDNGIAKSMIK